MVWNLLNRSSLVATADKIFSYQENDVELFKSTNIGLKFEKIIKVEPFPSLHNINNNNCLFQKNRHKKLESTDFTGTFFDGFHRFMMEAVVFYGFLTFCDNGQISSRKIRLFEPP